MSLSRSGLANVVLSAVTFSLGCGASVVFVDDGEGGNGGDTGDGGGGEGAGTSDCEATFVGERHDLCFQQLDAPCPISDSSIISELAAAEVALWQCSDICCSYYVQDVPCDLEDREQCCYAVDVVLTEGCAGRPFVVAGAPVVAPRAHRLDWSDDSAVDAGTLKPEARSALAAAWTEAALAEHASIASFARFALELLSLGAPANVVEAASRAMADEIAHAKVCFEIARAIGGEAIGPGPLPLASAVLARTDAVSIAVATVVEGCIGETLAAALAIAEHDAATEPSIRGALDRIARDEAEHAALAWRSVTWMIATFGAPVRGAVARALAEAAAFDVAEVEGVAPAVAAAYGRLSGARARDVLEAAIADVVAPAARALLRASGPGARRCDLRAPRSCHSPTPT